MGEIGVQTYRLSIAWPRLFPLGAGQINEEGIAFYDRLLDELVGAGIRPCITLYHWDLPQALQDVGGWANRDVAYRFADYATPVFDRLGDRVDRWLTLNEPLIFLKFGHFDGLMAPGFKDPAITASATRHAGLPRKRRRW